MAYLNSENVVVFPIAKERAIGINENRLLTEYNISNLIRQLVGNNEGFIISTQIAQDEFIVEFNLYGYYFKISGINQAWITENFKDGIGNDGLYASIIIDTDIDEVTGQDAENKYQGLNLTTSIPTLSNNESNKEIHYLKILKISNNGNTFEKINATNGFISSLIGGIDGKH